MVPSLARVRRQQASPPHPYDVQLGTDGRRIQVQPASGWENAEITATQLIVAGPTGAESHQLRQHPERPARIDAVMAGIGDLHLGTDLRVVPADPADLGQLARVHTLDYLDELRRFSAGGGGHLDPDTYADAGSWDAARRAAGAGIAAVDELRSLDAGVAFVAARPPGHHALGDRAMGFCLLNNVAVAAAHLVDAGERVLIVDWDVHHGNGTQALFWNEPNVLYVSTHQWPAYPGTGRSTEVGGKDAHGLTVNVPVPPGATGDVLRRALDQVAAPVIDRFSPTWVLVSAGFDAHRADPLADLSLSSRDFADLARTVQGYAPRPGRLALFLEGGYDLDALRTSVASTLGALLGTPDPTEGPTAGGPGLERVGQAAVERNQALEHRG
ncbi:MAG TPA: histone deacetylase [Acidimicrobiales bacterium]|jgi:acetoin utilization deacetylase AcuC-like enzyme|nr:histone deacetylase [Acidimicrobiales bacterium]